MHEQTIRLLSSIANSTLPRNQRAKAAATAIRTAGGYHWVGLYDVGVECVHMLAFSGEAPPAHPSFPRDKGLTGAAITARATIVSNDVENDPRYLTAFGTTGSEIIVPIFGSQSEPIGTIDVESSQTNAFDDEDEMNLRACALALRALWTNRR